MDKSEQRRTSVENQFASIVFHHESRFREAQSTHDACELQSNFRHIQWTLNHRGAEHFLHKSLAAPLVASAITAQAQKRVDLRQNRDRQNELDHSFDLWSVMSRSLLCDTHFEWIRVCVGHFQVCAEVGDERIQRDMKHSERLLWRLPISAFCKSTARKFLALRLRLLTMDALHTRDPQCAFCVHDMQTRLGFPTALLGELRFYRSSEILSLAPEKAYSAIQEESKKDPFFICDLSPKNPPLRHHALFGLLACCRQTIKCSLKSTI
jgi:hypothetical protein